MASIAGAVAGASIGGTIGGPLGAAIGAAVLSTAGGLIDSQFIFPAVFGRDNPLDGLKIDDFQLQTASEGSPLKYCLGPNNRLAGTVIWMDKVISKKKQTAGKSGPTNYVYYVNLAVAICEGPVFSIDKVWADSKLIWQKSTGDPGNNGSIVGTLQTSAQNIQGLKVVPVTMSGGGGDAAILKKGDHVRFGTRPTVYEITADVTIASGASGGIAITPGLDFLIPAGALITFVDWTDAFAKSFTLYKGTTTQTADPVMEAILGAGNVPGFRGTAFMVVEQLNLTTFGNRVPQFTFKLAAQQTKTVASAISDLLLRSGLDPSYADVSKVTGNLSGYAISGAQPIGKSLEPLMLAYNVDVQEKNGQLIFFTRTNRDVITCLEADLAAHEGAEITPTPFIINDKSDFDLPSAVSVGFLDKKNANQKGTAIEHRIDSLTPSQDTVDLPIVLEHKQARDIANRLLWDSWKERQTAEFQLPPSRLNIQEGDLVVVPFKTETYSVRVMDVRLGANFVVAVQGNIEGYTTDDRSSTDEDLPTSNTAVYTPAPIQMHVADIPSVTDAEVRSWGVYVAVCCQDPAAEWRGAEVFYDKNDANISLARKVSISKEATMGQLVADLGTPPSSNSWDNLNTIDISMWNGTLIGSTDLDVLNGANQLLIKSSLFAPTSYEQELIGFVNADLIGTDSGHGGPIYRLSRLLRNRRNTTRVNAALIGDVCTLINDAVYFAPLTAADFNKVINWRAVPAGGAIASYVSEANTFKGNTVKPWSPYDIRVQPSLGYRQTFQPAGFSVNVTWTWKRRSRAIDRLFTETSDPDLLKPLVETPEKYFFELYDAAGTTILRKYTIEGATTLTLTDAELDVIFAPTVQWGLDPIKVRITQLSPLVGRGDDTILVG